MSLAKASVWTAASTLIKILIGLVLIKLLAVAFGPEGLGQAGNFRQLITVLGVLAGAGIFNGVTKYIAEYHQQPARRLDLIGTASSLIFAFSTLLALIFLLAAKPISQALFGSPDYQTLIRWLALIQLGIAYGNFLLAILRGFRDARGNALAIIVGYGLGAIGYLACFLLGGYTGALIGLALVPALVALPAAILLFRRHPVCFADFRWRWQPQCASLLGKFTLMALITSATLPLAYILMRNWLAEAVSWQEVGLWQGVTTISDAYLQFITAAFTVYLLPTLSRLQQKHQIRQEIGKALGFVLPAVAVVSLLIWLLRDWVIWLLFSAEFTGMRDLFVWQLIGDVLKVGAYVFGYLVIARASLRFYLLAEITQFTLLLLFSYQWIPLQGALGAVQAYMATYVTYFLLCSLAFIFYCRRS